MAQDREPTAAEDTSRIAGRLAIDRQAEHGDALAARLGDRLAGVLHPVRTLVDIDIVWLAVGEDQQEPTSCPFTGERRRRVPNGSAHAGVPIGVERRNPTVDHEGPALVERLQRQHGHVVRPLA